MEQLIMPEALPRYATIGAGPRGDPASRQETLLRQDSPVNKTEEEITKKQSKATYGIIRLFYRQFGSYSL